MAKSKSEANKSYRQFSPAMTAEEREDQLIARAMAIAEKQLIEGTASSQVITHFLRLGASKERLEKEKLIEENKLLRAKTESIKMDQQNSSMYKEAIDAFRIYSGNFTEIVDDEYED